MTFDAPNGLAEIMARFGDPTAPGFERANIVLVPIAYPLIFRNAAGVESMTRVIRVHRLAEPVFTSVFKELKARGLEEKATHYGGAYTVRNIRGSSKRRSTHSWGIAIDINPHENAMGTAGKIDAAVVQCFVEHGFTWGGIFRRKDPMHFQLARGY